MSTSFEAAFRHLTIVAILLGLSACGNAPIYMARDGSINVEYSSSHALHFSRVVVYQNDAGLIIAGELHKRGHGRGFIPGHIDIEIIGPDDTLLATKGISYHRGSNKSRRSQLYVEIPIDLPINSTVRILHHDALIRDCTKS